MTLNDVDSTTKSSVGDSATTSISTAGQLLDSLIISPYSDFDRYFRSFFEVPRREDRYPSDPYRDLVAFGEDGEVRFEDNNLRFYDPIQQTNLNTQVGSVDMLVVPSLSGSGPPDTTFTYDGTQDVGVVFIATAGLISLLSVLYLLSCRRLKRKTYHHTNMFGYFICLLMANLLQSSGTVMNFKWVSQKAVIEGTFCSAQGALKQAGNVGTSLWSFVIALHLFNLVFLRMPATRTGFFATTYILWTSVVLIVIIGPFGFQDEKGPYFGISGAWCWITKTYPTQRIFLEYFFSFVSAFFSFIRISGAWCWITKTYPTQRIFFEYFFSFVSAFFSFILYTAVILRVRGNLVYGMDKKWHFQHVARGEEWKLAVGRDALDHSVLKVAQKMVWYPVAYTVIIVPITLTRFYEFYGKIVPFWATALSAVIFNLTGFVNVMLLIYTQHYFPEVPPMANSNAKSQQGRFNSELSKSGGIEPFILERREIREKSSEGEGARTMPVLPAEVYLSKPRRSSMSSESSSTSVVHLR